MQADEQSTRPRIGVTLGDVNGIGPEVVAKAIADPRVLSRCQPIVVGPAIVLKQACQAVGVELPIKTIDSPDAEFSETDSAFCFEPEGPGSVSIRAGEITSGAGQLAHDCLRTAARAVGSGLDAICTAPLNKAALAEAGIDFPGHTEILADEFGISDFAMMLNLSAESLTGIREVIGATNTAHGVAIAHTTLHTSVESVPKQLTSESIHEKVGLVDGFLKQLGISQPSIGVCALNPHAGEDGLFGNEEQTVIQPAVRKARDANTDARGPFPADTLIRRAIRGEFQGVVAMYHDQGHIPVKLIGFDSAINVTLGIPIVRTSPTHGTAFDIAWQGKANPNGMIEAMLLAAKLCDRN